MIKEGLARPLLFVYSCYLPFVHPSIHPSIFPPFLPSFYLSKPCVLVAVTNSVIVIVVVEQARSFSPLPHCYNVSPFATPTQHTTLLSNSKLVKPCFSPTTTTVTTKLYTKHINCCIFSFPLSLLSLFLSFFLSFVRSFVLLAYLYQLHTLQTYWQTEQQHPQQTNQQTNKHFSNKLNL